MAQAKTRTARRSSSSRSRTTSRNGGSSSRPKTKSRNGRSSTKPRTAPRNGASARRASSGQSRSRTSARGSSVGSAAESAARTVGTVGTLAKRAKTPLLAGGAAIAGLAGALVLRSRNHDRGPLDNLRGALPSGSHWHRLSLPKLPKRGGGLKDGVRRLSKNVSEAAQQADKIGQRVSKTANAVQQVSDTAEGAAKKV